MGNTVRYYSHHGYMCISHIVNLDVLCLISVIVLLCYADTCCEIWLRLDIVV